MSNDLKIKIDIKEGNQKTFQILEQPSRGFQTFFDRKTGVCIGSVTCPEFYEGSFNISPEFTLYLRGDKITSDFTVLTFYFDETDMNRLIKALTKFCNKMEWGLKFTGSYFNEIILGEL